MWKTATMNRTMRFSECFKQPDMDTYYLEDEQASSESSPSDDIWKKFGFEFQPTPPLSPSSAAKSDDDDERFYFISDFCEDDLLDFSRRQQQVDGEIISDCMWSGRVSGPASAAVTRAEQAHVKSVVEAPLPLAPVSAVPLSPLPVVLANFAPPFEVVPAPADCVDPYPLSDHSYHVVNRDEEEEEPIIKLTQTKAQTVPQTPKKDHLGVQTPSDSDDEVDVETIPEKYQLHKPRSRRGSLPSLPSPQVKRQLQRVVAAMANTPAKSKSSKTSKKLLCPRSNNVRAIKTEPVSSNKTNSSAKHKLHKQDQQKRSYHYKHLRRSRKVAIAAKLEKEQQQQKTDNKKRKWKSVRVKEEAPSPPPVVPTLSIKKSRFGGGISRTSSDSEDLDKRKEHNDLERRRRNDLKSSFQFLRQNVPDLTSIERAPKVLILRKAVDYIRQLNSQSDAMVRKRKNEERRHNSLVQRLKSLQWMLK